MAYNRLARAQIGARPQTLYNWRSSSARFRRQLDTVQRQLHQEGLQRVLGLAESAGAALREVLNDESAPASARVAAARAVLMDGEGNVAARARLVFQTREPADATGLSRLSAELSVSQGRR